MKTKLIAAFLMMVAVSGAFAAATVSDIAVRQRWPWSGKVDIDYTLTGEKGDVTFYATWDGQTTPVCLGTDFQVEAGQHRFEWDPSNKYADKTLTGFTVTASAGSDAEHKYLILDLASGSYSFLADVPEEGWTDEYKSTKMVFVRCPAGTYKHGLYHHRVNMKGDMVTAFEGKEAGFSYLYGQASGLREVTLTSDWYIGIFSMTTAQYELIQNGNTSTDYVGKGISYNDLRGSTTGTPAINWPYTKYDVAPDSFVQKMRDLTGGVLLIDLPQEEQYEASLRCGKLTFWPNGGTKDDSLDVLTNYANKVVNWYYSNGGKTERQPVGMMMPNDWGIYDLNGGEWSLDTAPRVADRGYPSTTPSGGVDPVGSYITIEEVADTEQKIKRVVHGSGGYAKDVKLFEILPNIRYLYGQWINTPRVRFAIHLKPLAFKD